MKFTLLPVLTLATLAVASPTPGESPSCSTGSIQCCDSTEPASSAAGTALLGLLGITLEDLDVLLGLTCSPITVIGVGQGSSCSAQTVCCEDNSNGGVVSIGCVPITL